MSNDPPSHATAPGAPPESPAGGGPVAPAALPPDDPTTPKDRGHTLRASRPSDDFVAVRRWVVEDAAHLRVVRADLRAQLAATTSRIGGPVGPVADSVVLVTSELATNALSHGRPPAQVRLLVDGGDALVVVSDSDTTHAPFLADSRAPGDGGFGLQIARMLASEVGWWTDGAGKHVWARFSPS